MRWIKIEAGSYETRGPGEGRDLHPDGRNDSTVQNYAVEKKFHLEAEFAWHRVKWCTYRKLPSVDPEHNWVHIGCSATMRDAKALAVQDNDRRERDADVELIDGSAGCASSLS